MVLWAAVPLFRRGLGVAGNGKGTTRRVARVALSCDPILHSAPRIGSRIENVQRKLWQLRAAMASIIPLMGVLYQLHLPLLQLIRGCPKMSNDQVLLQLS